MSLPSFIDMTRVTEIGVLVLMIVQYVKGALPDNLIRVFSILLGIAIAFGYLSATLVTDWTPYLIFVTIITGIAGAILADTTYSFTSGSKSSPLSLPSRKQLTIKDG